MKGMCFARIEEIEENRNRSCWQYKKAYFRSVAGIGKIAGISVLKMRGATLKADKIVIDK